jgi:hypothetical protein
MLKHSSGKIPFKNYKLTPSQDLHGGQEADCNENWSGDMGKVFSLNVEVILSEPSS